MEHSGAQYSYDEIPYSSQSLPQTHPDRLATIGRLFSLSPPPITHCRVLELGSACGANLIPMAYHLPESEFVGVELSERQVAMAHELIHGLNLQNVRVLHANILDVDISWGIFDYIICHGVYSWVTKAVQDRILSISSQNLAPQGIAYISYNTYPGWHMREMIRHMMLFHANQFAENTQRIQQARALMDFLGRSAPADNSLYGLLLQDELNHIKNRSDTYLFHEYLEKVNTPIYFHQFAERAEKHDLQYLADADFSTMLTSGFPKETAQTLERISQNMINAEQYMDFVRNRFFRQTLLCHADLSLKRDLGAEDLAGLLAGSAATPDSQPVNLCPGEEQSYRTQRGASIATDHSLTKAGLMILKKCWPRAMELDALVQEAEGLLSECQIPVEADGKQSRRVFLEHLLNCYAAGGVELHSWQADFVIEASERPRISDLAKYLIARGLPAVNQWHRVVNLDHSAQRLCLLLDGSRDRQALVTRLKELVDEGALVVRLDGNPITDSQQIREALAQGLDQALAGLAEAALLVG